MLTFFASILQLGAATDGPLHLCNKGGAASLSQTARVPVSNSVGTWGDRGRSRDTQM